MSFVGVDGCRSGWVAVVLRGGAIEGCFLATIGAVGEVVPDAEVIAIDMPIGLPEVPPRPADVAARRFLGRQGSSVFPTPVRAALVAATHAAATEASRLQTGTGISQQAFALAPKILEVEAWLPSAPCRVVEAHPEVTFRTMSGQVLASKKTWAGMRARQRALAAEGIVVGDIDDAAGRAAAVDDVLDAAAVAWTARRVAAGIADTFPAGAAAGDVAVWA
jgi:predicted RNase H-like nuclease